MKVQIKRDISEVDHERGGHNKILRPHRSVVKLGMEYWLHKPPDGKQEDGTYIKRSYRIITERDYCISEAKWSLH